jgi:hypothetical protein
MPLLHHEQCFGCGRTNLFGLLLEAEPAVDGRLTTHDLSEHEREILLAGGLLSYLRERDDGRP